MSDSVSEEQLTQPAVEGDHMEVEYEEDTKEEQATIPRKDDISDEELPSSNSSLVMTPTGSTMAKNDFSGFAFKHYRDPKTGNSSETNLSISSLSPTCSDTSIHTMQSDDVDIETLHLSQHATPDVSPQVSPCNSCDRDTEKYRVRKSHCFNRMVEESDSESD